MKCFLLLAVVALAQAGLIPVADHVDVPTAALVEAKSPAVVETGVSSQYRSEDNAGNYAFSYNEDHTSGGTFRSESGDALGNVVGSYGLKDADGRQRIVNYVADQGGFRANIQTNEPGVEPKDPADVKINKPDVIVTEPAVKSVHLLAADKETAAAPQAVAVVEPATHSDVVVAEQPVTTIKVEAPGAVSYTTVQKEPIAIHHTAPTLQVIPDIHYSAIPAIPKLHHSAIGIAAAPSIYHATHGLHYAPGPVHYISPFSATYALATAANLSATAQKTTTTASDIHHDIPTIKYAVKPSIIAGSPLAYYSHIDY